MHCLIKYEEILRRTAFALFATTYHINEIGNSLITRMSREWRNDSSFSPSQKKTYLGYFNLLYFSTVTLEVPSLFSFVGVVTNMLLLTQTISLRIFLFLLNSMASQSFTINNHTFKVCGNILICPSFLLVKLKKKRLTTTRSCEYDCIYIILQETRNCVWLKVKLVPVAYERMLEFLANNSLCLTSLPIMLVQEMLP